MDTALIRLSIIVVNWNTRDLLRRCLAAVYNTLHNVNYELFVVDNGSSDGSAAMVEREFPGCILIKNAVNIGHAAANNQALRRARGGYLVLLNSDTVVQEDCLEKMMQLMDGNSGIGALSAQSINADGSIQQCCRRFPRIATIFIDDTFLGWRFPNNRVIRSYRYADWPHNDFREVEQPPITCFMVRREVVDRGGFFDERFFLYFGDPDWCLRIKKAGAGIFFTPEAKVVHYHGSSIAQFEGAYHDWQKGRMLYYKKHFGLGAVGLIKCVLVLDFCERLVKLSLKRFLGLITTKEMNGLLSRSWGAIFV